MEPPSIKGWRDATNPWIRGHLGNNVSFRGFVLVILELMKKFVPRERKNMSSCLLKVQLPEYAASWLRG
jgi:hypothetical protein